MKSINHIYAEALEKIPPSVIGAIPNTCSGIGAPGPPPSFPARPSPFQDSLMILWWFSDDSLTIHWRLRGGGGRSCPRRCCCYHYQTWRKLLLQLKLAIWLTLVTLKPWHASAGKTDTSFQLSFARNPSGAKKKRKSLYDLVRVCVCVHVHVMVLSKLHLDRVISSIQLECFMGDNSNP